MSRPECPFLGCSWEWRHNMWRHCARQHPSLLLRDNYATKWDSRVEEFIVLSERGGGGILGQQAEDPMDKPG